MCACSAWLVVLLLESSSINLHSLPLHSEKLNRIPFHAVQGFDEYMNLVLDEAEEVSMKRKTRKPLGAWQCSGATKQPCVQHPLLSFIPI